MSNNNLEGGTTGVFAYGKTPRSTNFMNELKETGAKKVQRKNTVKLVACMLMLAIATVLATPLAYAAAGEEVIDGVLKVIYLITNVLGILFVIVGFVKLVIAHAQEDAPGQQKAAMFIATGLALILLRVVLGVINFSGWLSGTV